VNVIRSSLNVGGAFASSASARAPERAPALVAVSHGTSSPEGQAAVEGLVRAVATLRPDVVVAGGFVDVQQPDVRATLASLDARVPAVVVPLLLSAGYHVHLDLQRETAAVDRHTTVSAALGPDDRLVDVLVRRLAVSGYRPNDEVVLAAAGSSDSRAVEDCQHVARMLAVRLGRPVTAGFISAAHPRLADAVASVRAIHPGARVVLSTYLVAPGYFHSLAQEAGADIVSDPLLMPGEDPLPGLVDLVLERYAAARAGALS
jgi:sirohydrochlorin ferrochelatase